MTEKVSAPLEYFQFPKDLLAAQQSFLPSGKLFEQMSEAARIMTQAQIFYGEAVMRANAAMFGVLLPQGGAPEQEVGPCEAARRPEYVTQ